MDELHGIFRAYEMRNELENLGLKETTFKASKKSKKNGNKKEKEDRNDNHILEDDEGVCNLVRRLKREPTTDVEVRFH